MASAEVPAAADAKPAATPRWRIITARILVVLAAILALPAVVAGYVRWQAFDTPTFQNTASDLIADPVISNQIAATMVDALYSNVDVQASLEQKLPADQKQLAGPLTAVSRLAADRVAPELLQRPRAQAAFVVAATQAQAALNRLLEDRAKAIKTNGGDVYLDFRPLIEQLGNRIAIVGNLDEQLPADAGRVVIMKNSQLRTAQRLTSVLKKVGSWAWLVPVLLAGAAVALARGRRRKELRAVAWASIIVGALILFTRSRGGSYLVDSLVKDHSVRPAANRAWTILTELLSDTGWMLLGIGVVALVGVWLAGETRSGRGARRAFAPILGKRAWAFGIVAVLFIALIWWDPTAQTSRWPQMLALAILLAIATEALVRQTDREFPLESQVAPGAAFRSQFSRFRGGDGSTRELERLASLHDSGALTDAEFTEEKARVLERS
ncbi:MAG TPA: SHOCT domain-containing protein [Gaiellaceae bacterium]|nr:SHOCT domain-containing protein [Gaiellaceae bacterium]